jgi:phage gp29-like protein
MNMDTNTKPPSQPQSADELFFYLRRQTSHFSGDKVSPQRIANALYALETGNLLEIADIMSLMVHDPDLMAPLTKRTVGIHSLPWKIEPASIKASKKERRNAEAIEEIFQSLIDVPALLLDMASGILAGIALLEIADREQDDGTSGWKQINIGNYMRPMTFYPKFIWRPLSWFQLNQDNKHEIRLRNQSLSGVPLEKNNWVIHRHPLVSGYVGENGILRQLIWTYAKKNYADDDWSQLLEILGIPPRIGKYPPSANQQDKTILRRAVTDLGNSSAGIMPENMNLELLEAASLSGGNPFQDRIELATRTYERLILGASTDDVAKLSSVEGQRFINHATFQRNKWDCHFLQETIRHQIIYWINGYNYNEWDPLKTPKFVFDPRPVGEFAGNADALYKLLLTGFEVEHEWAHDFFNIPMPGEGKKLLKIKEAKTTTPPPAQIPEDKDDKDDKDGESGDEDLKPEDEPEDKDGKDGDDEDDEDGKDDEDDKAIKTTALKRYDDDDEDDIEILSGNKAKDEKLWRAVTEPFVDGVKNANSYDELDDMFSQVLENESLSALTQDLAFFNFVKNMEGRLVAVSA